MVTIKSKTEIEYMKEAGRVTGETLKLLESLVKPGVTTLSLDKAAEKFIRELESKYHINPLIISRREAVDLSIKKLPGLASLVNYAVYDSSKKSPKDEEIYPTFDYN